MKRLMLDAGYGPKREFCSIHRGLLDGCELYLSERDRLPMRAGIFEREIGPRFTDLADRARVFADVGAAEGFFSIYMLRNTEAKIFAFETAEDFGDILLRNLDRNGEAGRRVIYSDSTLTGEPGRESVDAVVGDQEGPVLIKIDVEGDELEVLDGARSVLEAPDTAVIVRVHDSPTEARCLRLLNGLGFKVEIVGPAWWRRAIVRDRGVGEASHWLIADKENPGNCGS